MLKAGPLTLDRGARELSKDGEPVSLTFSEFEVIAALMAAPGRLLNRQELMRAIWGDSAFRDPRGIDVHVRHLREKLEADAGAAGADPDRARSGIPARGLRAPGLRARLVLALFATAATTLAVAALALLPPLEAPAARRRRPHADAARRGRPPRLRAPPAARRTRPGCCARSPARPAPRSSCSTPAASAPRPTPTSAAASTAPAACSRPAATSATIHHGIAQAAIPLRFDGQPAALALRRRLGDVGRTYVVVADAFAGAALAGLALALIGGFALSGRMLRRLRGLSDAMLAADPMLAPAEVDTARDELGELARAFAGLQQRLAQQEDARRMFVATASHELRTPLTSAAEPARADRRRDRPRAHQAGRRSRRSLQAQRLSGLSKGLLDLSRLDAGAPLRNEPIELGELSRAVAAEFDRPRWIEPRRAAAGRTGDPEGVARIVRLLVDNALRYAPDGAGRGARRGGQRPRRRCASSTAAPASATSERDAIFERFQRGEHTSAPGLRPRPGDRRRARAPDERRAQARARRPRARGAGRRALRAHTAACVTLPPGPREPAALQTVEWIVRPTALLRRAQARYGEPFTLRTAWTDAPLVLTSDPQEIKRIYAAPPDVLQARRQLGDPRAVRRAATAC